MLIKSVITRFSRTLRFGVQDHRSVFQHIYKTRYWGDRESVSGPGSSMLQTANISEVLPRLIARNNFSSMFDAPCGDLHWMAPIISSLDCKYSGGDIVPGVIDIAIRNSKQSGCEPDIKLFDIMTDDFPNVDVWMCRDVLFHFSFRNIRKTLDNFSRSSIKFVLVTSHKEQSVNNRNIATGDFRHLNLLKSPFKLRNENVVERFDDYIFPSPPREMLLLRRDDFLKMLS